MYLRFFKRVLDIVLSLFALVVLSPVILIVALLICIKLGTPVFFSQIRPGKHEKLFKLYKFRTMTDCRDPTGVLLPDEMRLTRFGRTLRATSLDELPELWNILKGDMSIVGPRPLLEQYLPLYSEEQRRRHDVRPGLTGLAQINGRNALSWIDKFAFDLTYVNSVCFVLDFKIVLKTVLKIIKRDGISSGTSVTMEEFVGGKNEK